MTAPTIVTPIPDQEHEPEAAVSFSVAANFADAEDNGLPAFSATGLPTGLSINSSSGIISGSSTVAGTHAIVVTCTAPDGVTRQAAFSITIQGAPSSAQTYHVNGATGNDSWTGLSATFTSGTTGPWASITRANQVAAHASGHVEISVAPGTYRNQPWVPQNSGTDASHRIKLRAASDGVVSIKGPSSGTMQYGIRLVNRSWMEIVRDSSTRYVEVDGEVEFGTGAGQVAKGDAPGNVARCQLGVLLDNSNNNIIDLHLRRLGGDYNAVHILNNVQSNTYRPSIEQSGTPYMSDGYDSGDGVAVWRSNSAATRNLIDGGSTGRLIKRVGHDPMRIGSGSGCIRGITVDNSWGGVPTFSASQPDGNRCGELVAHNAVDAHVYNFLAQRNGMPQDGLSANICEIVKLYGTRSGLFDSALRNGRMQCFFSESASWTHHSRGCRIAHCVVDEVRGPLAWLVNWTGADAGQSQFYDFCMKNIVARRVSTNARTNWIDKLLVIELTGVSSWTAAFPNGILHGFTLQDASRDWDDFLIDITGGGAPGVQTVQYYLTNHPTMFSNFTITTDANLDNAPAPSADATLSSINTEYLPVSDSLSIAQGVHLTTVHASDTGSGTTLLVNDASWFDNPVDGLPGFGPHSAGFFVNVNGTNREYTAINYTASPPSLTMAAGFSRSAGQSVNRRIASGSVPNRGIRASN